LKLPVLLPRRTVVPTGLIRSRGWRPRGFSRANDPPDMMPRLVDSRLALAILVALLASCVRSVSRRGDVHRSSADETTSVPVALIMVSAASHVPVTVAAIASLGSVDRNIDNGAMERILNTGNRAARVALGARALQRGDRHMTLITTDRRHARSRRPLETHAVRRWYNLLQARRVATRDDLGLSNSQIRIGSVRRGWYGAGIRGGSSVRNLVLT